MIAAQSFELPTPSDAIFNLHAPSICVWSFVELHRTPSIAMAAEDQSKFAIHEACREGRSTPQLLPRTKLCLADVSRSYRRRVSA